MNITDNNAGSELGAQSKGRNPIPRSPSANHRHGGCRRTLILSLLLFAAPALLAQGYYLTPGHPDGVALLAPPPAAGSAEEAADLAAVRAVVKARTPVEAERAIKDANLSIFLFEPAIGPFFKPDKLPKTEALFHNVKKDLTGPIEAVKQHWKRRRPYEVDENLSADPPENDYGYPSAHSTRGTVQALILAELFPEHKEAILEIGRNLGWDRVLLGKHFPTDVHAGRVLGQAFARALLASRAFRRDLAQAKAEVLAAQR